MKIKSKHYMADYVKIVYATQEPRNLSDAVDIILFNDGLRSFDPDLGYCLIDRRKEGGWYLNSHANPGKINDVRFPSRRAAMAAWRLVR